MYFIITSQKMLIFPLGGAVHDIIEHGTFFKLDTTLA